MNDAEMRKRMKTDEKMRDGRDRMNNADELKVRHLSTIPDLGDCSSNTNIPPTPRLIVTFIRSLPVTNATDPALNS